MNIEIWKPIEGFTGYELSNLGRVRSFRASKPKTKIPYLIKIHKRVGKNKVNQTAHLYTRSLYGVFKIHEELPKYFPSTKSN